MSNTTQPIDSKQPTLVAARGILILRQATKELAEIRRNVTISVSEDKAPEVGVVLAIGAPKLNDKGEENPLDPNLLVGSIVAYRRFGESKMYLGSTQYYFVDVSDLLAIIYPPK